MGFFGSIWRLLRNILVPMQPRPPVLPYAAEIERARAAGATIESPLPPPRPSRLKRFLFWTLHILLVAAILVGLYFLNAALHVEQILRSPLPELRYYWLPLLFLLLYLMAWLGWWLWELTGPDKVAGDFPDLNSAWAEVQQAVAGAGVELREVPLFLVLGRPLSGEESFFTTSQLPLRPTPPRRPNSPLGVYVTRDAVFLTCAGASLLGRLTALLVEEQQRPVGSNQPVQVAPQTVPDGGEATLGSTVVDERSTTDMTEEQRRVIGILVAEEQAEKPRRDEERRGLFRSPAAVAEQAARLRHLCGLIARARRPYCPINGVLVVLPFAVLDSDNDASQAASAAEQDLEVARVELEVQCPVFALFCDLHRSPGFREFLTRLPAGQRDRRLGQRFPLVPDVEESAMPGVVQQGVQSLCDSLLPSLVYNLFRVEGASGTTATATEMTEGNLRLYGLLAELRERHKRLSRLLTRGLLLDKGGGYLFGGVYLSGTSTDANGEQVFVGGVFQRLIANQNHVAWTPEALATEARYRRWAAAGCLGVFLLVAGGLALTYALWRW